MPTLPLLCFGVQGLKPLPLSSLSHSLNLAEFSIYDVDVRLCQV